MSAAMPRPWLHAVAAEHGVAVLDGLVIVAVSLGICLAADRLALMSALVPGAVGVRFALWARLPASARGHRLGAEVAFFAVCTALGGFNDWNSVVHHRIYDYTVPVAFPALSTIPVWMLVFWGVILRFIAGLAQATAKHVSFQAVEHRSPRWAGGSVAAVVAVQLGLVLATRQCIYRWFDDPILSWLPFAAALAFYLVAFGADAGDRRLLIATLLGGPLIEVLYIQVGGLHRYHLGWLGGVPVWIALWWVVSVLIWKDLSGRALRWTKARWPAT